MYTYLTQLKGTRAGSSYILLDDDENRIGRGLDCQIVLNDPLSSRVHAIIECREGVWWVYDAQSRNGTYVNQQKADEAQLIDGCQLRVGSTEFEFSQSADRPPDVSLRDPALTQTIVRDTPIKSGEPTELGVGSLQDTGRARTFCCCTSCRFGCWGSRIRTRWCAFRSTYYMAHEGLGGGLPVGQ